MWKPTIAGFIALLFLGASLPPAGASTPQQTEFFGDYWVDYSDQHRDEFLWDTAAGAVEKVDCEDTGDGGVATAWTLRVRNDADYRRSTITCTEVGSDGELTNDTDQIQYFSYNKPGDDRTTSTTPDRLPVGVLMGIDFNLLGPLKVYDVAMIEATVPEVIEETGTFYITFGATLDVTGGVRLVCDPGYVLTGVDVKAKHHAGGPNQAEIRAIRIQCSRLRQTPEVNAPVGR